MKTIRYFVANGLFFWVVWEATVGQHELLANLLAFVCVMLGLISTMLTKPDVFEKALQNSALGYTIPVWFDGLFDTVVIMLLAAHGHFWSAGFYLWHTIMTQGAFMQLQKRR